MATLVKEKRKDKKKSKDKRSTVDVVENIPEISIREEPLLDKNPTIKEDEILEPKVDVSDTPSKSVSKPKKFKVEVKNEPEVLICSLETSNSEKKLQTPEIGVSDNVLTTDKEVLGITDSEIGFKDLASKLRSMAIPQTSTELSEERKKELENSDAYLKSAKDLNTQTYDQSSSKLATDIEVVPNLETKCVEDSKDVKPSAPLLDEEIPMMKEVLHILPQIEMVQPIELKVKSMPLQDAIRLFGGREMTEMQVMSEREEAIVEAGPVSGPDHPLVDLLSTFRSSLIAVERERNELTGKVKGEERCRNALWKIEKRTINISEPCPCGATVYFKATYEHAELLKEKLPVAKMKLESLLRDVQDSYCHHQHAALLAHCQIEELISETIKGGKGEIREALSLILQALRMSDTAPEALASALQRWASALAEALVDARDLRQLLFLIHHLFRQTHSVKWASRFIRLNVEDSVAAARVIALLEILMARPKPLLDTSAVECTEEIDEVWEEVDKHGSGGAVSEGTLRERDLLSLLSAFPLRDLVSRLVLFTHVDISQATPESWGGESGARGAVRACCGVRALLHVLCRAAAAHARYPRLHRALRRVAGAALAALAGLHLCSRDYYTKELRGKICAELEACFTAGLVLFGTEDLDSLPTTLLADDTAMDYCVTLKQALHDKSPRRVETLSVELPVVSCELRVRMVSQAAVDRTEHHQLARTVLDFLLTTCLRSKSAQCRNACVSEARTCLPRLLQAHTYLFPVALHTLAELHQIEPVEPWAVAALSVGTWRPVGGELRALLDDWLVRCEHLIQHLLLNLDYTPHTGVSLDTQLMVGTWLCGWTSGGEARWRVLRALRVHRTAWRMHTTHPPDPPDPPHPPARYDLFATAHALLTSSWGHSIPLICAAGVSAVGRVCAARPRDAVHCAAPLMSVMALSPESVSLTPQFGEVFSSVLGSGPSLVQRALGRGTVSGSQLLLTAILHQLETEQYSSGLLQAWAHALWGKNIVTAGSNSGQGLVVFDVVALATRDWPQLDAHAAALMQEENYKEHVNLTVRMSSSAPLVCSVMLRAWQETSSRHHHAPLLYALHHQRTQGVRIHVDNALQQIDAKISSEELTIYRSGIAASAAPLHHPAHLTLWRLFMHLYLERPPGNTDESVPPLGPLFFSGIIKSRALAQIKKRLQDTATYHHNEAERIKTELNTSVEHTSSNKKETSPKVIDVSLFPTLTIIDLTGESIRDSDSDEEQNSDKNEDENKSKAKPLKKKQNDLLNYHVGAEKMIREYLCWIEEGDKLRATQHHADIARFISEQALEAGWQAALAHSRPPPVDLDSPIASTTIVKPPEVQTPFRKAVNSILKVKDRSQKRLRGSTVKSPIEDINVKDSRALFAKVDTLLKDIQNLAQEWSSEVSQISTLDSKLWELVSGLRVRRSLPPVKRACPNKCKPITIMIPHEEWCISTGAENGIRENRGRWVGCVRKLSRARPHSARTAAALHALARRAVRDSGTAAMVAERLWRCTANAESCTLARQALADTMQQLAETWISRDGHVVVELVSRWSRGCRSEEQLAQCVALVSPRLLPPAHWPHVYITVLKAPLPDHLLFSCLSKFEISRWSDMVSQVERRDILEALTTAATRWGAAPTEQQRVAVELVGVQTSVLLDARELVPHVMRCTRASQVHELPPTHWAHVVRAAERCAATVPFDQMGNMLRQLGTTWWAARGDRNNRWTDHPVPYSAYAPHLGELLFVLTRMLLRSAVELSYDIQRVARYGWGAACETWSPWVMPYSSPPLLPLTEDRDQYTPMLVRFVDALLQIMADCPGTEEFILQHAFEWSASTCAGALSGLSPVARAQAPLLLEQMARLPWHQHQWCYGDTLQTALQMSNVDQVLQAWCCSTWRYTSVDTWMRPGPGDEGESGQVTRLVRMLHLFTATTMPHHSDTLEEVTRLPWWKLPDRSLDQGLEYFFSVHGESGRPYHDQLQYNVLLHAAGLRVSDVSRSHASRRTGARAACVSRVTRALSAPAMLSHAAAHCRALLDDITNVAPYIESSEGETEDLLSRAIVIMCIEPTAAAALPVWEQWIRESNPRLVRAILSAVSGLTVQDYFAPLADVAVATHLAQPDGGWREVCSRWGQCPWRGAGALVSRGRLRAAYGCALVCEPGGHHQHHLVRDALDALVAAEHIDFVENEVIIAVWICYLVRACVACPSACSSACSVLLTRWAEPGRRSLLRVVTMQADTDRPTLGHRLLCRLGQCIISPSETTTRAYEAACAAMGNTYSDVITWGTSPTPDRVPRLASRLYPKHAGYFEWELELATTTDTQ